MIIKLIQPLMEKRPMDTTIKQRMSPSLALLTIANIIPPEHKVVIENENIENINYDSHADLVGITVTVDTLPQAAAISKKFRERGVKVIAGGIHIMAAPETARNYFDSLCIGVAEKTWPQIIKDMESGCLKPEYRYDGSLKSEEIVAPNYSLLDSSKYLYTNVICTSRGCPFKCDFCYNSCEGFKNAYVTRTIDSVLADIKAIGKRHIMFIDDNFIGNPRWTTEFLQRIIPMNLKWNAAVSTNIANMPDLLDLMKLSGCQSLFIGFESINDDSIENVHKVQNSVEKYEHLIDELHKRGIMINASFVFGLDGDDKNTFRKTLDWIVKNRIETVTSHILTPYPGTKVYDDFVKKGRITDSNLANYTTSHVVYKPINITAGELYDGYIRLYRQIYSFKNIMRRLPKSKNQRIPYLTFNFLYRKYGKFTERLCNLITYNRIGRLAEYLSYKIK